PGRSRRLRGRRSSFAPRRRFYAAGLARPACGKERVMATRTLGWRRAGSRGRFRYLDQAGKRIADQEALARIDQLRIPPAWRDVWISPRPRAKLQATGTDSAGRRQYLYH